MAWLAVEPCVVVAGTGLLVVSETGSVVLANHQLLVVADAGLNFALAVVLIPDFCLLHHPLKATILGWSFSKFR